MSPLWRDEVAIFLSPRRLALARRNRGIRPRVVAATEVVIADGAGGDVGAVVGRLADLLGDRTWHGAAARVVVADHPWVRYAIVPAPSARLDEQGRLAHARYVLADAYGEAVADGAVTLADTPPGRSSVACGMPAALRSALADALSPARLALVSLQPRLVVAFNAWRQRVPADDAWFVSVDDGALAAAHLAQGVWDRVHLARPSAEWHRELERLEAFDRATRTPGSAGRVLVDAPVWLRPVGPVGAAVEWLGEAGGEPAPDLALLRRVHP